MNVSDLSISFPRPGVILLRSQALFGDAENPVCHLLLERISRVEEISDVIVTRGETPQAELRFAAWRWRLKDVVRHLASLLSRESAIDPPAERVSPQWEIKIDRPGRLRVKNPLLYRKSRLCRAIERELLSVIGVDRYKTSSITCAVQVDYNPRQLTRKQVIEILDSALDGAEHPEKLDAIDIHLPLSTLSLPLAAVAQFAATPLLPVAAVVVAYTSIPTFQAARRVFREERRVGVDALDAVVVIGCLGTLSVFPGAVMSWCLSFGRFLVRMTRDNSQRMLLNAFGKQPRFAWLCKDGVEVQVPAERLEKGDIVVVHTGEVVPVDGQVVEGLAMIDQQTLTGEAAPAEKAAGDRVFAATILVGGKVHVMVERSGSETASAQISQILAQTAGHKLSSQHKGERLADQAVLPTLAAGAVGMATMGPIGAVAVLNSDLGTGIRMAAPLAMLSSLALCAHRGILVKDGRALELMNQINTVLFDKTGTLTHDRPEVGRIIAGQGFNPDQVLGFAAAAERKFHHPIALAILQRAEQLKLTLPSTDDTQYKIGYGITVQINDRTVRVGSKRFLEMEGVALPAGIHEDLDLAHREGHTMVLVAVNDRLGGAIELRQRSGPKRLQLFGDCAARNPAHRRGFGRPRSADPEAGRVTEHGPLFCPGPAGGQSRLRRAAPEGGAQGVLRRGRNQRLDRAQAGRRVDLVARGLVDRDRHGAGRLSGDRSFQAVRAERHRTRPRSQRQPELVDDRGPQCHERHRRLHDGFRHHGVGDHQ